jgi:hypothetical protein
MNFCALYLFVEQFLFSSALCVKFVSQQDLSIDEIHARL